MASSSAGNKPQQPWSKESTPSYVVNDRPTAIQLEDAPHNSTPTTSPPPTKPTTKSSFHHLFTFTTRGHVPLLLLSLGTAAAVAAARTAYAVLLGHIFQVVSRFGAGLLSPDDFLAQIARWAVWLCVLGAGMWLFATVDAAAWVVLGELRARCVREQVFGVWLRRRAVAWFEAREEGVGALVAGVQSKTRELQTAAAQTLGHLVCDVFVFAACIIVAFVFSFKLTLVMLATGVPSALILWAISRFLDPAIEAQKRELAQAAKHATAATTAIDLVKVYNAADQEAFQFTSAIRRSAKYYTRQVLCNCGQMSYVKLWMIMLFVLGFYFSVVLVTRGELTPGEALTTFYAVLIGFQAIEALGPQWLVLAKGMAAGQWLHSLVKEDGSEGMDKVSGWRKPPRCLGDIRMSDISFAYPSNPTKTVLWPSTLRFEPGQLTFVVGRSGSGKSTLGNLLVRFYEPLTGKITVDGTPITTLDLDWLRQNVTLIQQSSIVFGDSFFQNVALGAPDPNHVPLDAVQQACSMALLQSTIADMPNGVDTVVGPGGYSLSGGQKQRLALARARLRDPPVLILDEVTSGLDPVSRSLIMEAVRLWRKGKTTIIITHEVGHIEDDDYVYVLADGCVIQQGPKREIAEDESGLFASLLASADDSPLSSSSASSDGELDSESFDDEPIQQAQQAKFLRGTLVDNNIMSVGLFSRFSLRGDALSVPEPSALARSLSHKAEPDRAAPGKLSRTSSIQVVAQRGLGVQKSRTPNARQGRQTELEAECQASLDSLELFFLERLAKRKDRGKKPTEGPLLPSLTAILKTVWPALDKIGKGQLVLGLLLCLVIAASTPLFSFFFVNLLQGLWLVEGQKSSTGKWAGLLAVIAIVDASATFFGYFFMEEAAQKWVNSLRAEAFKRILSQPKSWFDMARHSPSRITQCLDRNAEEMRKLVCLFVPILLTVTTTIFASLIWALIIRWDLTLVTLAGVPVAVAAARANSLVSDKWEAICDDAATSTGAIFSATFINIKVVRALTLERNFTEKHSRSASSTFRLGVKRAIFVGVFHGLHQALSYFITALVFFYGSKILREGLASVMDVIRVINLLLFSLGTSVAMLGNLPQIAAAKATALQLLYYANLSHAASHEAHGEKRLLVPLPVRMTNLRFAYPSAPATQVLRNINLEIAAGTCTAIVGASGCGKSTIASLLLRLYDPLQDDETTLTSHRPAGPSTSPLTYASIPCTALHTPTLRNQMAYVPQTPFLFPATIRANLAYGLHEASPLRAQANLARAARQAHIHDFIASLPQGYDTPVGDGGLAVSGGQAQRLCIARALARRPRLLVLDEPTSALDAQAAAEVRGVVQALVQGAKAAASTSAAAGWDDGAGSGMAVVVITHSKEMMRIADSVVMVDGGAVVEQGGYQELVAKGGKFAALVRGGVWTGGDGADDASEVAKKKERSKRRRDVNKSREEALRRLEGVFP
ncbi:uncharacterized protein THITE_2051998 [Thermothielavioides terrestris NRRL 8126]|uniref:ABC transporter-like protein n=1 Tax=Thermothielavioides terrestris (strain ATCC 38088 / NRRL 8126) TaxID=578455 RepID=G2R8B2_THETT|nr:uncharacterized protein THITE_2051998 [Thermothielavioides terrestris NRRL 8126]AEO68171.1 hypothetical protein THITE_2051998 [Thermothielavioides terrestris NRRL 8126]